MVEIVLFLLEPEKYNSSILDLIKKKKKSQIVYVTANNSYEVLVGNFKNNKINPDKILFIDCISKKFNSSRVFDFNNCIFLDGPEALTSLSISITECLNQLSGKRVLFFDSLSALLIYNDSNSLSKFSSFLLKKLMEKEVDTIIFSMRADEGKDLITLVSSLASKVIRGEHGKI